MKNSKTIETNQALAKESVNQEFSLLATALTEVTDCKFTVMENGNILPVLYYNPVYIRGKKRNSALIGSWSAFDSIAPRIGSKVLLVERDSYMDVYHGEMYIKNDTIKKPNACPICKSPI